MDLKTLIYTKGFGNELTQRLLFIADSKTWLEDFIDLIGELNDGYDDCEKECEYVSDVIDEKEEVERDYDNLKTAVEDKTQELRDEMGNTDPRTSTEDSIDVLSEYIEKYVEYKTKDLKVTVGGIEIPKQ